MQSTRVFPVPEELKVRGIERFAKEKDTLVVVYEGKLIRFGVETKCSKTVINFTRTA